MARSSLVLFASLGSLVGLLGCPPAPPQADTSTAPSSSRPAALATPSATAPAPRVSAGPIASASASASAPALPPTCKVGQQKVWGAGANKLTGLTTHNLANNQVAVGFALGTTPHVLVVNKGGGGQIHKVEIKPGSRLASPPKAGEGTRHLLRVSPISVDNGKALAMADYRDEYRDKRRFVACGPAHEAEPFLSFEGTSYLDLKEKPSGEERKKLFGSRVHGLEGYAELRDCRSFFSRKDQTSWVIGSHLHGIDKGDSIEWQASLGIDFGPKEPEHLLHSIDLKDDPPKGSVQFEVPASIRIDDKGHLLATRFGGSLLVGWLDPQKKLRGKMKSYTGLPLLADLARTSTQAIVTTAIATSPGRFGIRSLLIPLDTLEMPKSYTPIKIDDHEDNETEPELVIDKKGQRWLAYLEGERDKGHLEILPLDDRLQRMGRPYVVTEDKERAAEVRVIPMDDGDMMVVYLRDLDGKVELVTEELSCEVKT